MSSCGYVLAKKWGSGGELIATTAWQLVAGGLVLVPVALVVEGAPPALDARAVGGFAYVVLVATAGAYLAWFAGLRHLDAAAVGLVGLLNRSPAYCSAPRCPAIALPSDRLSGWCWCSPGSP